MVSAFSGEHGLWELDFGVGSPVQGFGINFMRPLGFGFRLSIFCSWLASGYAMGFKV